MVEFRRKVSSYGSSRRHIEIPKEYYDVLNAGDVVIVISKDAYDRLVKG